MTRTFLFLAIAGMMASGAASAQQLVASVNAGGFYIVNPATAAVTLVPGTAAYSSRGLGNGPTPNVVDAQRSARMVDLTTGVQSARATASNGQDNGYTTNPAAGIGYVADNGLFASMNLATGTVTALAGPGDDVEALAVDVANNVVYGFGNNGVLRRYSIAGNAWSSIGAPLPEGIDEGGLAFDPATNTLYLLNRTGNLFRVNPATGAATLVGSTGLGFASFGLTWTGAAPIPQGVQLDAAPAPLTYASEIIASPGAPVTLLNPAGDLNLSSNLGYSFSNGEVRYARFECNNGLVFAPGSTAQYAGAGIASVGAVNGLGSSAINFSVTANNSSVVAADRLVIDGARSITGVQNVNCSYSLYDFPSQAAAGGAVGRLVTVSGPYLSFATSYALEVDNQGNPIADVESPSPAYSRFTLPSATSNVARGQIGGFSYDTRLALTGAVQPLNPAGVAITLADLMGATTALRFAGDFSVASNVFLSTAANCAVVSQSANPGFNATQAAFTIGSAPAQNRFLCFATGSAAIPVSAYSVTLDAVSAAPLTYAVADLGPLALGAITRNGTELQAPLAQIPGGFISRLVLTNTGTLPRPYSARILREGGNAGTPGTAVNGTIPANGTIVVNMADILGTFTSGRPRGTVVVTVAAPNGQIQGLYQIVKPETGAISNHVMVRPGTN